MRNSVVSIRSITFSCRSAPCHQRKVIQCTTFFTIRHKYELWSDAKRMLHHEDRSTHLVVDNCSNGMIDVIAEIFDVLGVIEDVIHFHSLFPFNVESVLGDADKFGFVPTNAPCKYRACMTGVQNERLCAIHEVAREGISGETYRS